MASLTPMNARFGPVPVTTLGQLREQVRLLDQLPDTTPLSFFVLDEDLMRMSKFPNTWECEGLVVDAVDSDGVMPVVFSPLSGPTKD